MNDNELLNIADFFVILYRGKKAFLITWILVMVLAVTYLAVAKKSYKLTGTLFVGRIQQTLIEEGEFVAAKLRDFSFITRALENGNVELDIPVSRLQRLISTEVVNEVKKTKDVGLVQLSVEYKDAAKTHAIYKALTDQLIADHQKMVGDAQKSFQSMIDRFWKTEEDLRNALEKSEARSELAINQGTKEGNMPTWVMLGHTIAEQRNHHQTLVKDIYYLELEGDSATKTFSTRLTAEPRIPDEHFKPKRTLVVLLGGIMATMLGLLVTLGLHFYQESIRPKLV